LFVGKVRHLVLGNGSGQSSTDARYAQYALGLPKVVQQPFGHGIGQSGIVLGYAPNGFLTVDTYYITLLLDYGVAGFVVYFSMFGVAIYEASRRSLLHQTEGDETYLAPLAMALINFVVIKSVFSQPDNHPLVFMMLGAIVAIISKRAASVLPTNGRASAGLSATHK
jgi:hypothetical protein